MTTYYISTTGLDTNDGSFSNPFLTINKALQICNNSDTIKFLDGTYTITSVVNVTKSVTITSNSTDNSKVIITGTSNIFNIQSSNVSITYLTLQNTSLTDYILKIDIMSDCTTVPTIFTGINITNCTFKYTKYGLLLNSNFTCNNNTFNRLSGTENATIITCNLIRGCNINTNTFTDTGNVNYFIYLSSLGSDTSLYYDYCNSKGGICNISGNMIYYLGSLQSNFIYMNYFNQYNYVISQNSNYNINSKLNLTVTGNNFNVGAQYSNFINLLIDDNNDLSSIDKFTINGNTIYGTDRGIIHLDKPVNSTKLTINSSDTSRNLFKIYSNNIYSTYSSKDNLYLFITNNSNYIPKFWFRANSNITFSSSNYINNWTDVISNKVATANKSGTANYPTLDTTSESFPFIRIGTNTNSGTNGNYFNLGSTYLQNTRGFSYIVVIKFTFSSFFERLFRAEKGVSLLESNRINTSSTLSINTNNSSNIGQYYLFNNAITGNWQVIAFIVTPTSATFYNNSTTPNKQNLTMYLENITYDNFYLGRGSSDVSYANYNIREYMVYDWAISTTDMESIITQLKTTYSI